MNAGRESVRQQVSISGDSRSGKFPPSDAWDEFTKFHAANTPFIVAADSPNHGLYQWNYELDFLNRNEVAELVALMNNGLFIIHTNADDDAVIAHSDVELSFSSDPQAIQESAGNADIPGTSSETLDPVVDLETNASTITRTFRTGTSDDVLYHAQPHQTGSFEDATNGTGGPGSMHMSHQSVFFREKFGRGPFVDSHTEIYEHLALEQPGSNSALTYYSSWTLVFDVWEEEEVVGVH